MVSNEQLSNAKRRNLLDLLPQDLRLASRGKDKYMALCVFHDDSTPSMSLRKHADGNWRFHCFGCDAGGDVVKYVQLTEKCSFEEAVLKLTNEARTAPEKPRKVAEYDYYDESGVLLYQVLRFEPKGFRMRRPTEAGWSWCLDGLRRVLYRLPAVLSPKLSGNTLYYVEGEKDVETLERQGLLATTHAGGAGSYRKELLAPLVSTEFRHKLVVIPDMDEKGKQLMRRVFADARALKLDVGFLLLPRGKDVSEWFELGGTLDELLAEVK